jgi:hypothetical protein
MKTEQLFERGVRDFADDIAHNMRYQRDRTKDAALATIGSKRAHGRLLMNMAAKALNDEFMRWVGANGIDPITDDAVRDFVKQRYPNSLSAADQMLQQMVGPANPRGGNPPPGGGYPAGTPMTQTQPLGAGDANPANQAGGTPPPPAPLKRQTPQQQQTFGQLQTQINQGIMSGREPHLMDLIDQYIQNAKGTNLEHYAKQFLDNLRTRPDALIHYPDLANIPADPFVNAQPTSNLHSSTSFTHAGGAPIANTQYNLNTKPSAPPAASIGGNPPAAAAPTSNPQVDGSNPRNPHGFRSRPGPGGGRVLSPAATSKTPPPTPAKQTQLGAHVHGALAKIGPLLRKPALTDQDKWWVLAAIDNALRTTQRGSPARNQVSAMLRAMKQDPRIVAKIPQLAQIPESRDKVFDLAIYLVENQVASKHDLMRAYARIMLEAVVLNRSQLNQILVAVARDIVKTGQGSAMWQKMQHNHQQIGGAGASANAGNNPGLSHHINARAILNTVVTPAAVQKAMNNARVYINKSEWNEINQAIGKQGDTVMNAMGRLRNARTNVLIGLLYAAEYA